MIHVRAGVLLSDRPGEITSWRDHYARVRVPFMAIGIVIMANIAVLPWVMGRVTGLALHPGLVGAGLLGGVYLLALIFDRREVQGAAAIINFAMILMLLFT